jgi:hypothetical protein
MFGSKLEKRAFGGCSAGRTFDFHVNFSTSYLFTKSTNPCPNIIGNEFWFASEKRCYFLFHQIKLPFQTPAIPYVMGLRNAPIGSYLHKPLDFWTFHVNVCPPLLTYGRKKFMAGYELLSEVQRDFDPTIVGFLFE